MNTPIIPPLPSRPTLDEIDPAKNGLRRSTVLRELALYLEGFESRILCEKNDIEKIAAADRAAYIGLIDVAARSLKSMRHIVETNLLEISLKTGGVK
ncbi:hypothetical protein [Geminisphaera colitermitum]|uniref:hypothetical protein n=1 Tax=Geminisphaera colitermitum TaxID=1148786 RepID=UPI000158CB90|nr:hypothetical protein [Geminisphaera colitermitum]